VSETLLSNEEVVVAAPLEPVYEVVSPLGRRSMLAPAELAPRLPDLTGRTVAFVWDHVFSGDRMFSRFEQVAAARFAGVKFVAHEAFGNIHGTAAEEHEAVELLPERLRALGVDVAVVGVGA
jgi:hypothetical protein